MSERTQDTAHASQDGEVCEAQGGPDLGQDTCCPACGQNGDQPAGEDLAQALAEAEAQRDEYLGLAQRVQADFDNFRRRNQSVRVEALEEGEADVLAKLLPVLDNLERAVSAAQDATEAQAGPLLEGVDLVLRQLRDLLEKQGVSEINRLGEPFDAALEHAVLQGTPDEGEPGTVCEVLQKGYRTENRVLRYAMVKVVTG
ncbi:MAG: nucleotide exchange factor GrpE [Oscillospiraceae bacterium]|jgi:molecular chaperone GrpE|nr:nucleotide exchange factor GrpE [Oscillospiraceae bacterium]